MFLLFDFVHIMKNIRNNWITAKTQEIAFSVDGMRKVAKWNDIKIYIEWNRSKWSK